MSHPENKVLTDDYHTSNNFFESDLILRNYLKKYLPTDAYSYIEDNLQKLGETAANSMDELAQQADRNPPALKIRSKLGKEAEEVTFHPAYWELMDIAAESEMFYVKYHPEGPHRFRANRNSLCFALGQLYAMSELGQYCPHCMTDGAAFLIEKYALKEDQKRLLPRLSAKDGDKLFSGAMFLTEKSGGSDVGANLCKAQQIDGRKYRLNGEKWFCSNVNADVMMVLARTGPVEAGTRGLSLFLVEKQLPNGQENPKEIIRLKDKLGVRSMATGEVRFHDTIGKKLGEEGEGFKLMAQMINISRNYNSMAALAGIRRAIIEAWQYLNHRLIFGKRAVEHALIREKFYELGSRYIGNFLLVWRSLRAMDAAESGDEEEQQLLRMITPMSKWWLAEQAVYSVRECMELMGGNGYIEDFVMPRILRDVNVLPIWEGSGNVIVLDMLRASEKSSGLEIVIRAIEEAAEVSNYREGMKKTLSSITNVWKSVKDGDRDQIEATVKPLFKQLIQLYQMALITREMEGENTPRYAAALQFYANLFNPQITKRKPLEINKIEDVIGWEY
ncbi:MAG: acyl-CoA dehydrogenase family protein [Balneolaceae bacterium]|jgi:alkylation response protein AidB-like acyl-CoA dehydrogenase